MMAQRAPARACLLIPLLAHGVFGATAASEVGTQEGTVLLQFGTNATTESAECGGPAYDISQSGGESFTVVGDTVTSNGQFCSVLYPLAGKFGKLYLEFTRTSAGTNGGHGNGVGVQRAPEKVGNYHSGTHNVNANMGPGVAFYTEPHSGDSVNSLLIDLDAGTVSLNGGEAHAIPGTGDLYLGMYDGTSSGTGAVTWNWGGSSFAFTPPAGADAWCNLQVPTADVASGTGDPHLSNIHGEHFDIHQTGNMALLHLPRLAEPARTMLLVEADARSMVDVCFVYFQTVTISGEWTNRTKPIQFFANTHGTPEGRHWKEWMRFGPIDLKVALRNKGVDYLNVYARNIGHSGYEVGGILGLDDHTAVAKRPRRCANRHVAALLSVAEAN